MPEIFIVNVVCQFAWYQKRNINPVSNILANGELINAEIFQNHTLESLTNMNRGKKKAKENGRTICAIMNCIWIKTVQYIEYSTCSHNHQPPAPSTASLCLIPALYLLTISPHCPLSSPAYLAQEERQSGPSPAGTVPCGHFHVLIACAVSPLQKLYISHCWARSSPCPAPFRLATQLQSQGAKDRSEDNAQRDMKRWRRLDI